MKKNLHILFLCGWYPSKVLPTNGNFIQRHAETVSLNHKVSVLHIISDENLDKNRSIEHQKINGVQTTISYVKKTKNPFIKLYRFWSSYKILIAKIDDFDMVHLNELYPFGIFALHLKWFKKKPFIVSEHWTDYKYPLSKKISFTQKIISKIIAKNASFICPVTKDLQQSMITFGLKSSYKVVENVVDTEMFYPIKNSNKKFTIVHISNMNDAHKNIKGILNVVCRLASEKIDFEIKIIGKNAEKYKVYADELNIDKSYLSFANHISHKEISEHLQKADLFILFSNFENLPCVILESFACGVPVISTNVGGISEYFPTNFGELIEAKNEVQLLKSIKEFYSKELQVATKEEMHTYIHTNFSPEAINNKFTGLYKKSLKA